MLTKEERTEIIKDIFQYLQENCKEIDKVSRSPIKKFEHSLPLCTIEALIHTGIKDPNPVIEIIEHFGRPTFVLKDSDKVYDGLRQLYHGSYDGLDEVALQGLFLPNEDEVFTSPSERLIRFKKSADKRGLTSLDEYSFDRYLIYVSKELGLLDDSN